MDQSDNCSFEAQRKTYLRCMCKLGLAIACPRTEKIEDKADWPVDFVVTFDLDMHVDVAARLELLHTHSLGSENGLDTRGIEVAYVVSKYADEADRRCVGRTPFPGRHVEMSLFPGSCIEMS